MTGPETVARACVKYVDVVVGSTNAIADVTAPKFTYAFYQALANGRPYANAFRAGQVEVRTASEAAAARYELFTR